MAQQLDQGVSALINDLTETGQLEDTLVVVTGEFGRTPRINSKEAAITGAASAHWPWPAADCAWAR